MKKLLMTTAVGLCLAAPAFAQTADQKGLVTVNLQDVLNNLSADLKIDRANIPVTAQIPINAAANVCGVNVNVLSAQAASGPASCNAKTGSQDLTQAVQQQMAAGGTAAGQSGTTAAVNNPPASTAPSAATTAPKPATTANAPAAAPAANPLAQNTPAPAQQNAQSTAAPAQNAAAPVQQNAPAPASTAQAPASQAAPAQQNAQSTAAPAQQRPASTAAPAQQNAQAPAAQTAPVQQNAQSTAAPAQPNAQPAQGTATRAAPAQSAQGTQPAPAQNAQSAPAAAGASTAQGTSAAQPASASNVLDSQQQSKIADLIVKEKIKPANVNFSINQGVAVPSSVALHPVPSTVLQLAPQYRGYSYFATSDRIVIVEPSKKTVVAVIPTGGNARAQSTAPAAKSVQFTQQQRDLIRKRTVTSQKTATTTGSASRSRINVREQVPDTVTLEEFSEDVVREVPTAKSYRYYRQDNDVVVVDPGERRVIEVIR
ncbi:MAG: hypothetical protein QOJ96_2010 [Alphaproteobacteria bacterium]|jgi:hypothetical protein|nr:hypothetical protein [Alphaproteobacteria bacterium]